MSPAAVEELRLCHAALAVEALLAAPGPSQRSVNAEAFQRALWTHREAIMRLIDDADAWVQLAADMRAALTPFGRCASILPAGQNPVLISLPDRVAGGRTFVQLRPSDFRAAAALSEVRP